MLILVLSLLLQTGQTPTNPPVYLPDPIGIVVDGQLEIIGRCAASTELSRLERKDTLTTLERHRYAALVQSLSTFSTPSAPLAPNGVRVEGDTSGCARPVTPAP